MGGQRALVTGATGFIGSHLVRRLLAEEVEVHAVVRPSTRLERLPDHDGLVVHVDDGSVAAIEAAAGAAAGAPTYHLATNFLAEHAATDIAALVTDNVTFTARLADAVAAVGGGPHRFVNVGTAWQHVDGAAYRPKNLYAATKQAAADVLEHYAVRGLLSVVTVNLYDTYGPGDDRGKLLAALVAAARTGGEPLAMSGGHQLIDLVHVDDVVAALRAAATGEGSGPYAVSSGEPRSVRAVVEAVATATGRAVPVTWGARPDRPQEMLEPWAAGPPVPGWSPSTTLADGLRQLVAAGPPA